MTTTTYTFSADRNDENDCLAGYYGLVYSSTEAGCSGPVTRFDLTDGVNVDEELARAGFRRTGVYLRGEEVLEVVR